MVKETIKSIKVAEQDATKLARETSMKQERMLTKAKEKVLLQKEETESELVEAREIALKEGTKHNEELMNQAVAQAKEEALFLRKHAELKQTEVFQLILTELI